jgi:hypothetical protein
MMRYKSHKAIAAGLLAGCAAISGATAGDQAKAILNSIDPKSMNELFEALPRQPDAALTNIAPVSANKFRFLFVWPASNQVMTYERVGRSFAERFADFAAHLKPLALGFCLTSRNMFFGSADYAGQEVNVAFRDIEVHYQFGWQAPCAGRYIRSSELEQLSAPAYSYGGGFGAAVPGSEEQQPPKEPQSPEDGLKPFLNPAPDKLPPE